MGFGMMGGRVAAGQGKQPWDGEQTATSEWLGGGAPLGCTLPPAPRPQLHTVPGCHQQQRPPPPSLTSPGSQEQPCRPLHLPTSPT
jgi:hypothetical protein